MTLLLSESPLIKRDGPPGSHLACNHTQDIPKIKQQASKTLTPAYMSDRRAKGLCYLCDEPFTPEHGLSHKTLQMHVMEVDELQEGAEEEVLLENSTGSSSIDPQIFVHALTGIAIFS